MKRIDTRSKLFLYLDRLAEIRATDHTVPVNVEIDLSNRCSLGCEWCHFAYTHTRGPLASYRTVDTGDLMDRVLALDILKDLEFVGVRSVTWTGGGEPTLHPHFDEIVSSTFLSQGMYTNGCHINSERAQLLKDRFEWVYVSLDAHDGEFYSKAKGVPIKMFEKALSGLRAVADAPGSATVGVGQLITEANYLYAMDMALVALDNGADYVQFRPTILYDENCPDEVAGPVSWLDDAIAELIVVRDALPEVEVDLTRFEMLRDWTGHPYDRCWWSQLQTVITPDGRVWTCLNKRGFEGEALGDLNTESFASVWSRSRVCAVNGQCRVMCRGTIANRTLAPIMNNEAVHGDFL